MAKRKGKKSKSGGRRRRRVGAVHPAIMDTLTMVAGAGAGAVAASFVAQGIKSSSTTMPPWIGGGAMVAIGAAIPLFVKGSPFVNGAAAGMAAMGMALAVNETFISLPGIAGVPAGSGLPNAKPGSGYFNRSVGTAGYKGIPGRSMGTFSGANKSVIGAILSN